MPIPTLTMKDICAICAKTPQMGMNRPHSQHTTKTVIRPNLNRWGSVSICARCRKAMSKPERVRKINPPRVSAQPSKASSATLINATTTSTSGET